MQEIANEKTFCVMPWIARVVRTNGVLSFCGTTCLGPTKGSLVKENGDYYNALKDSIDSPRNSPLVCQIRKSLLLGEKHSECKLCWSEEEIGLKSRRKRANELSKEFFNFSKAVEITDLSSGKLLQDFEIVDYDLRFGNTCNLGCRTCGPQGSSFWYKEWVKIFGDTFIDSNEVVKIDQNRKGKYQTDCAGYLWYESEVFWSEFLTKLKFIKRLYFAGGEPLILPSHNRLIDYCVQTKDAKHIELSYNTNLTKITGQLLKWWGSFARVDIQSSIDFAGTKNDYIRYPSNWDQILKNLIKLDVNIFPNVKHRIVCTVSVFNIFYIPEFLFWHIKQEFVKVNKKSPELRLVQRPYGQSVQCLPNEIKKIISIKYERFITEIDLNKMQKNMIAIRLKKLEEFMYAKECDMDQFKIFLRNNFQIDLLRKQKFKNYFPEFYELLPIWIQKELGQ